jgi:hypothetical protein
VVITLQKRIYQFRRHQSYPHLSGASVAAFDSEKSPSSHGLQQTERAAWKLHHYQIMKSVTEKLVHLMSQLVQDLQAFLLEHQESYLAREQALQREIISDLALFAQKEHRACHKSATTVVAEAKKTLKKILNQSREEVWASIVSSLNRAKSNEDLEGFSHLIVSTLLLGENDKLRQQLNQITSHMQQAVNDAANNSSKQFNDAYRRLLSVEYKNLSLMAVMDDPGEQLIFSDSFSNLTYATDGLHQSQSRQTTSNIDPGATIETFIIPDIGTSPGTAARSFLEAFSLSLEKKRDALREKLESGINQQYEQLQIQLDNALNSYEDTICYFLDQQINAYMRCYKSRVEALEVLQKHDLQHLQQAMQAYLEQIKQHQETLQQLRQKLTKIAE